VLIRYCRIILVLGVFYLFYFSKRNFLVYILYFEIFNLRIIMFLARTVKMWNNDRIRIIVILVNSASEIRMGLRLRILLNQNSGLGVYNYQNRKY